MKRLLILLAIPAFAQIESIKFHYGDDPRWADPNFDDSDWIDASTQIDTRAHLLETFSWARMKVRMPDHALKPVVGMMVPIAEAYAEGRLIGKAGEFPPAFRDARYLYHTWPIPLDTAKARQVITVAVRIWRIPAIDLRRTDTRALSAISQIFVHPAGETTIYQGRQTANHRGTAWAGAVMLALLVLLFGSGGGQWRDRTFTKLVALVVLMLGNSAVFASSMLLPWGSRYFAATAVLQALAAALQLELIADIAGVRPAWLRAVQGFNLAGSVAVAFAHTLPAAPSWLPMAGSTFVWGAALNFAAALALAAIQKSGEGGRLLLTLGLSTALGGNAAIRLLPQLGLQSGVRIGDAFFSPLIIGNILFATILAVIQVRRLRLAGQVAVKLQAQFAAARGVQEALLGGSVAASPGYAIDPVYRPADEVGGDFFRILPAPGDCTLVIVGDVSGKGLRAAMLVSVIVGILMHRRSNDPAEVLQEVNGAIHGQLEGGFVTCGAALLGPDGRVKLANAGHIAPYCGGVEVGVPAGLPLGLVPKVEYESLELTLRAGEQLTFLSDGVVEAASPHAELFGFEQTRAISGQGAAEIAAAAQAFGQNDDITVVTVRRLA